MTMLGPLSRAEMTADQARVHDAIASGPRGGVRGPFPALLRRPELAERVAALGEVIRYGTVLPPRLLEVAILVTARTVRCDLEWHAHSAMASKAGVADDVIEAIRVDAPPPFDDDDQRLVHDFARQVQQEHRVRAETHAAVRDRFGELGVVDLAAVIGYFAMVATTINAHGLLFTPDAAPAFDDAPGTPG
jgi:4-carboxymuconolactone decarboxylase